MKYKLTEDGAGIAIDATGLPIVIDEEKDNQEFGLDAIHLFKKVPALQEEAKTHRLKAKEVSAKLELFGDLDPVKALEAIKVAESMSVGDLTKKEEVERIKLETESAWKVKFDAERIASSTAVKTAQENVERVERDLRGALLSTQFASSVFFNGKEPITLLTPDIAEAYFGKHYRVEKDENTGKRKVVGYIGDNLIFSKKRPGEPADFDESMEAIIEAYPMKEAILHKSQGTGATGGSGSGRGPTVNRGDQKAFGANLENIASGKVRVV